MLTANLRNRQAGFAFLQDRDDLALTEFALSHCVLVLPSEVAFASFRCLLSGGAYETTKYIFTFPTCIEIVNLDPLAKMLLIGIKHVVRPIFQEEFIMRVFSTLQSVPRAVILAMIIGAASSASAQTRAHVWSERGPNISAGGGGYTTWSGGSAVHQGGYSANGVNGSSLSVHNSVTVNPNGAAQSSFSSQGRTVAGGNVTSGGTYSRTTNGTWTGSSQGSATGPRGSYTTSTSVANGVTTHNVTGTTANGQTYDRSVTYSQGQGVARSGSGPNGSYNAVSSTNGTVVHTTSVANASGAGYSGSTSYTPGVGVQHSGSCTNASGQVIKCP